MHRLCRKCDRNVLGVRSARLAAEPASRGTPFLNSAVICIMMLCIGCEPPNVSIEETPIKTTDNRDGAGPQVVKGDLVRVDYRIKLPDGATLLQYEDYQFSAGTGTVIEGIDEAVIGMRAGGSRTFTCPPQKHWGRAGHGDGAVPPNVTLTIELKVKSIE